MKAYLKEEFITASLLFEKILDKNPSDMTARLFYEKAILYNQEGTPDNWDGVEIITTK